ncbi:MAG: hypothetical protein RIS34_1345 [Pseudomonadota bacterium]
MPMHFETNHRNTALTAVAFMAITLPWLNPFTSGPSPAAVPLLFSWACAAVLLGLSAWDFGRAPATRVMTVTAWAWLFAGLISSLAGLCQYFGMSHLFSPWMSQAGLGEAFANLRQRNQFATLANISLAALIGLASTRCLAGTNRFAPRLRWAVLAGAGLLAAGNAASSSRTGLVQLALLGVLYGVWGAGQSPLVRRIVLVAGITYAVAAFALPRLAGLDAGATGILARLHDGGPACASRLTLWGNVLHLIAQKPGAGWGWGELDYGHFITLYPGARFCDILDNAHNLPLHLAVELGVPVAALICGVVAWLVIRARPWQERDARRQMAWAVLAVIGLHSLLEYPLWYGPFQMAVLLCVGLLWHGRQMPNQASNKALAPVLYASAATLLIAFTAWAAWDYHRISQIYLAVDERSPAYRANTLDKIKASWLFQDQVQFAELTTTELTPDNAAHINALAKAVLHFSPEARVVERLLDSALLLGDADETAFYLARYQAAFAAEAARWAAAHGY